MELASQQDGFRKRGLAVAALSYDSPAVLKDFATRRGVTFPLLSDHGSVAIRSFGLLNPEYAEGHMAHGIPYPGMLVMDENGIVREKYFEEKYANRRTAQGILTLLGDGEPGGVSVSAKHLTVRTAPPVADAFAGSRVTLVADVDIEKGMHAYAPGAQGYRVLRLRVDPDPRFIVHDSVLPEPRPYEFKPLRETVPVFEGRVRILQDLTVAGEKDLADVLSTPGRTTAVHATLEFQVCSATVCFPPGSVPITWTLRLRPLDRERPTQSPRP